MFRTPTKASSSCKLCLEDDNNEMVSCDECEEWYHFKCVDVDESVAKVPWSCEQCKATNITASEQLQRQINQIQKQLADLMKLKETNEASQKTENQAAKSTTSKQPSQNSKNKQEIKNVKVSQKSENQKHIKSTSSRSSRNQKSKALARLDEEYKLKLEHLQKRFALEEEESDASESSEDDLNVTEVKSANNQYAHPVSSWLETQTINQNQPHRTMNNPMNCNQPNDRYNESDAYVTMKQISMRQVMSTNIPKFAGSVEDWPMFISWFQRSSIECNFTDDENLSRLHQCLQGPALELVKGYLFCPGTLQQVLNILRNKYGRPEQILQHLNDRLRAHSFVTQERIESILDFSVTVQHVVAAMKASGLADYMNNPILMQELVDKMSGSLKWSWAEYKEKYKEMTCDANIKIPNLSTFASWLSEVADKIGSVATSKPLTTRRPENRNRLHFHAAHQTSKEVDNLSTASTTGYHLCILCNEDDHHLRDCPEFPQLMGYKRRKIVNTYRLCKRCLGTHHTLKCKLVKLCQVDGCKLKHHPSLHDPTIHGTGNLPSNAKMKTSLMSHHRVNTTQILSRVVPVILYGKKTTYQTFAFVDEGSTTTMIEEKVARILELDGPTIPLRLKWTGDTTRDELGSKKVSLQISGTEEEMKKYEISDVRTVKSLDLPVQVLSHDPSTSRYKHLLTVPALNYKNAKPQILIGLNNYNLCLPIEIREGHQDEPIATKTKLGWTIFGKQSSNPLNDPEIHHFHTCSCVPDDKLHNQIQEFFSTESFGVQIPATPLLSKEDHRANEILKKTTRRKGNRYETGLLWRYDDVKMPDSYGMAKKRFMCLESKMHKNPELANNLKLQVQDYCSKGYARKLKPEEVNQATSRTWYLPLFSVTNPNKPGKIRMVWDAAAKANGFSLNSVLLKGPDLLCSLTNILFRFRERNIAICGDIKEMFHQIEIRKEDQDSQRFLWRDNSDSNIGVYVMCVMTFGASCSPSIAHYIKDSNARRFQDSNPRAVLAITDNHYVDDWLDSFSTEEEALSVAKDVVQIHAAAGFEIRNFVSNSDKVLEALGIKKGEKHEINLNISNDTNGTKVLGMWWSTMDDSFFYATNFNRIPTDILGGRRRPTKREVLRTLMLIFDPLGLISCFLVYVKILLQEIWRSSVTWDQPINEEQHKKWIVWIQALPKLQEIKIPRCYNLDQYDNLQMHVFMDASINAFAATVFYRFDGPSGIKCVLVSAKTKVAPQQPLSIPRLELQAAVLGTRLANSITAAHSRLPDQRFFWSDSIDVLCWLRSEHRRYRQFVAFRVGEILETTKLSEWRWVPTKDNVADEGTKWKDQPRITSNCRWFTGPEFLYTPEEKWPAEKRTSKGEADLEKLPMMSHFEVTVSTLVPKYDRFSNWNRMLRAQAWALRVFYKAKNVRIGTGKGELVAEEIEQAEIEIFRHVQAERFKREITELERNTDKPINKSSPLYKLTPFLDENGLLRVKGRAKAVVGATYDSLNPIILPRDHPITELILLRYHCNYHHENHEQTINEVRQRFAVTRLRRCMQKVRTNCQTCKNERAKPAPPQMAEHPPARVATFTAPFSYVGLDYFGPLEVTIGRRVEKRWVALFTCLTIRAVHLEVVHSLNKPSCWMAIRNFIARRGTPIEIRSDNGTNFVGVANELRKLQMEMEPDDYRREFGKIRWLFNPPLAPHTGGCWERLVKSIKRSLLKLMPTRKPNDETLRCYLSEAENIVNSRPLTHVSVRTEDSEALTPNHLLLGSSSGAKPFIELTPDNRCVRTNYELSQQMANQFWCRWIREYLPELTRTTKWFTRTEPIKIGDLVIIMDDKRRDSWRRGKIIDVIKGATNGQVRRVIIQTSNGIFTRAAAKVAVLDVVGKLTSGNESQCTEGEDVAVLASQ